MNTYLLRYHLQNARARVSRLCAGGPAKVARLLFAVVCGLVAIVALVALLLAAVVLLVPVAAVVIVFGGIALGAWPWPFQRPASAAAAAQP